MIASIKNLEVQIGQITQQIASSRTPGSLPSEIIQNPRNPKNVNVVTTRSKKDAKYEKVIPPENPTEEKNKKETKPVIKLPYHMRATKKEPRETDFEKFMTMFKKIETHIPFLEALERMPMYIKFMEEKNPGAVTVSCTIKERTFKKVLIDSGASMSLMPLSIYHRLGIENVSDTRTNLKFADHSIKNTYGIAEGVLLTIGELNFPIDFVIIDIPEDEETPIIIGRPFMRTS
ncbi:uncharacterized protein LOC127137206 [Lathyrus oleraceus]|uniref:uncharacterized protein LOC127137206 n=1 Tax=Pisum sativum TaxID=3888 RepID=UPI0021D27E8F|nr:uncharacterized protein LOC127137206 [Pisum sativum]